MLDFQITSEDVHFEDAAGELDQVFRRAVAIRGENFCNVTRMAPDGHSCGREAITGSNRAVARWWSLRQGSGTV
ncbi:hypothetical protein [Arthrobacter sp. 24S4-2]|uniref:hypothetical protein n=1 Tax=Arthrobacter sp. 24S4-2 TaxID=2575374 RepID=UPI001C30B80F|nr:hypothetical protein [Arthrobacter sp. 24S4-2]